MASSISHGLCGLMQHLCKQPEADKDDNDCPTSATACTAVAARPLCGEVKDSIYSADISIDAAQIEEVAMVQEAAAMLPPSESAGLCECNEIDSLKVAQTGLLQELGEATAGLCGEPATTLESTARAAAVVSSAAAETQQTEQLTTATSSNSIIVSIAAPAVAAGSEAAAAACIVVSPSSGKPPITSSSRVVVEAAHVLCTDDARSTIKALLTELFKPAQQRRRSDTGEAAEFRTTAAHYKVCLAQLPDYVQSRLLELGDDDKAAVFKLAVPLWLGDTSDSKSLWDCLCIALQQHRQRRAQPEESKQQDKLPKSPGKTPPLQDRAVDHSSEAIAPSAAEQEQKDVAAVPCEKPATVAAAGSSLRPTSPNFSSSSSIQEQMTEDVAFLELARLSTQPVRTSFSLMCRNADHNTACLQGLSERRCAVAIYNLPKREDEVVIKQLIKAQPKTCISDDGLQLLKELATYYVQHIADAAYLDPAVPVKLPGWVK